MARRKYSNQGYNVLKRARRYQARFKDQYNVWQCVAAYGDHAASMELARKLRRLAECKAAGHRLDADLTTWLDGLPIDLLTRLVAWQLIDMPTAARPMADHLAAWHASILADGSSLEHADQVQLYVKRMIDALDVHQVIDIDKEAVKVWLAGLQVKIETRNHHLRALKQFCLWMIDAGRAQSSPVAKIRQWKITDKRERRALSSEDFQRLITATEQAPDGFGLTGPQRATLYWLAAETGFRANELRSLTAANFQMDTSPPLVTVRASHAKNKREDTLAVSDGLALRMRHHFQTQLPNMPAFRIPQRSADMIRGDLECAGIPAVNAAGEHFDFHALRVQCASNLARSRVHLAVAQARMRHSDPKLTMNIYTKLGYGDQAQALQTLPKIKIG